MTIRSDETRKIILIAEDFEDVRLMMKFLVSSYGYDVIEAADGYEAVEKAKQYKPDLILMDISMPLMDGLRATQIIRSLDDGHKVPIIAVTAFSKDFHKKAIAVNNRH
jgi:CheY-like chemotaxis protein